MLPLPSRVGGVLCIADCTLVWFNRSRTKAIDPSLLDVSSFVCTYVRMSVCVMCVLFACEMCCVGCPD